MNNFVFILKDNNQKAFNSFFWFLYFLHSCAAAIVAIQATITIQKIMAIVAIVFYLLLAIFFLVLKNKIKLFSFQVTAFVIMVFFWVALQAWWPAIISVIAIVVAIFFLQKKSSAVFSSQKILLKKSLFKKEYSWASIANVILKDHLLSIDFKNNQLHQIEIMPESFTIDENAFNNFCRQQLWQA